jgi:hypothetical protein
MRKNPTIAVFLALFSVHLPSLYTHAGDAFTATRVPPFPLTEELNACDYRWWKRNVEYSVGRYFSIHILLIDAIVWLSLGIIAWFGLRIVLCLSFFFIRVSPGDVRC